MPLALDSLENNRIVHSSRLCIYSLFKTVKIVTINLALIKSYASFFYVIPALSRNPDDLGTSLPQESKIRDI